MGLRDSAHILTGLALGAALGVPPAPPILGYLAALAAALALRRLGLLRGGRGALEYLGALAVSWVVAASLLHLR
ncbi:MAG: hypothetical protein QXE91_04865 [Thermofilaceae archaeon]